MNDALPQRSPRVWVGLAIALAGFVAGAVLTSVGDEAPLAFDTVADEAWTCSMHPDVRQPEPGDCPLCGMDLIQADPSTGSAHTRDKLTLSPRARALAGIRTTEVRRQADATEDLRLLGRVEAAETQMRNVVSWITGRIDDLTVNTTGETVSRQQTIATLFSPEVYAAHQDLLSAKRQLERVGTNAPAATSAARAALSAAEERLNFLGIPREERARLANATEPVQAIRIRSPYAGTVIERVATEGSYVQTGETLYRIADLSTLWVQLDAYEQDLGRLAVGQTVSLNVEAVPGTPFTGTLDFIEPTIDAERRTARVRVVVANPDGVLRPGMFAEATVNAAARGATAPLVIPATAPLFTGRRSVVYVETQEAEGPAYTPREVRLGTKLGDVYPVMSGLLEGERVVSRGAFVVDADLQIRGGHSMMRRNAAPAHDMVIPDIDERMQPVLRDVFGHYLAIQRALAADELETAREAATALGAQLNMALWTGPGQARWRDISQHMRSTAERIEAAADIAAMRTDFEPLAGDATVLLQSFGNPLDVPLHLAFCPMAFDNRGATWIQAGTEIANSYFGASMLRCGEIRDAVAPATWLDASEDRP